MQAQATYQSYYTKSQPLVDYMVKMLGTQPGMRILEPCAGDGAFIDALIHEETNLFLEAYEMNPAAIATLRKKYKGRKNICITHADTLIDDQLTFLANAGGVYDRIIANPPYGAWQDFEKRKGLKHMYTELYVKETYTLFLLRCIQLLSDGGRLVFIIPDTFLNLHRHTNLRKFLLTNTRIEEIVLFPTKFFPQVNFGYSNLSIITLERAYGKDNCLDNQFRVLTGFKKVEDLGNRAKCEKIYTFVQKDIYTHPHHAFFVSDFSVMMHLNSPTQTIGDIADCVTGIYSGNDKKYLRSLSLAGKNKEKYTLLDERVICSHYLAQEDLLEGISSPQCFIPIVKGGAVKYLKPDLWYIDWSREAVRAYKTDRKARFQNPSYYFRYGIGIPMVSSSHVTASFMEQRVFDQSIVGVFPHKSEWIHYLLAFFNSPTCNTLLRTINPSANNSANYIKKIPFILPSNDLLETVNSLVAELLVILKRDRTVKTENEHVIHSLFKELYGF